MKLNRAELKKIIYEFNSLSNRLLQADFNDYNNVLSKYVSFLTKTEIIFDYILDCGTCDQDMEQEFKEVQTQHAVFDLGETTDAILCFNNGSGSWDTNSNKKYEVKAGEYLVNQVDKTVTKQ